MSSQMLLALLTGYLLGSIPFGLILTRIAGHGDVRETGSGNIGATNVLRAGGKGLGAATLLLDALKGTAAVLIAKSLFDGAEAFAAAGALVGHLYPVWLKFRGGKGVATYFGVLLGLLPVAGAIYAAVWVALLLTVRISSVAGMGAAVSAPVSAALLDADPMFAMLVAFSLLVIWRHRANLFRLKAGTEPKIGKSKS